MNTSVKVPVEGFCAKVPDAFLYRCSKDTEPQFVRDHLVKNAIKVKSVDLISHRDAASRSFKVCLETVEDFDQLLSRKFIPKYVKVKIFIPRHVWITLQCSVHA